MKKLPIVLGICSMLVAPGCANNGDDTASRDIYEESGNTINVNNKRAELYRERGNQNAQNLSENYGFVRHQKSPIQGDNQATEHYAAIDREQVANIISGMSTDIPNVNDVATLVTDQEVLITYSTDSKDRNLTADQVKRTAMSVVPRYYHVYVSDDKNLMRDIENLANLDSDSKNARNSVNQLITLMKKSPQGYRMNNSEDENGVSPEDMDNEVTDNGTTKTNDNNNNNNNMRK